MIPPKNTAPAIVMPNRLEILQKAVDHFGINSQIDVAIEEMAELTQALVHYKRGRSANIEEEIADVYVILQQIEMYFGSEHAVDTLREYKIDRLALILKKEGAL